MRTLVMGDSHGGYRALLQVAERAKFDKENDQLICLGDVVDGWPDVKECVEWLMGCKNLIMIIGNHDRWFLDWATMQRAVEWRTQGGQATFESYVPPSHIDFFKNANAYHIDEKNRLFVHGGFDLSLGPDFSKQNIDVLTWDRRLVVTAKKKHHRNPEYKLGNFDEVFVGHTSTTYSVGGTLPTKFCNLWMMDTGGGWEGKLTMMDVDTKEFWQSDIVASLYPETVHAGKARFQFYQDQAN